MVYGGENAPPSWARLPGARCRAVEHLTKLEGLQEFEFLAGLEEGFFQARAIASEVLEIGCGTALYREGEALPLLGRAQGARPDRRRSR